MPSRAQALANITRVLDVWNRFTVSSLGIGSGAPAIEDPIIDRRSERNKSVRTLRAQRANDGNGYLLIGHGVLVLEPVDPDLVRITEKVPVTMGSDADVEDAVALVRSRR